jgi:phosphoribosyl-dephospho-CoA transferase
VPAWAVRKTCLPLPLAQVIVSAPPAWQTPLSELDASFAAAGLRLRVYGSLAWQHITHESYVTDQSDVDLLFKPKDRGELDVALTLLQAWEQRSGLRADGEVLLPDGAGVAWRELLRAQNRVLVKSAEGVRLCPVSDRF